MMLLRRRRRRLLLLLRLRLLLCGPSQITNQLLTMSSSKQVTQADPMSLKLFG